MITVADGLNNPKTKIDDLDADKMKTVSVLWKIKQFSEQRGY